MQTLGASGKPLPAGSFLVCANLVFRQEDRGLARWDDAGSLEDLTARLEAAGRAYLLEEESPGRVWIHCR